RRTPSAGRCRSSWCEAFPEVDAGFGASVAAVATGLQPALGTVSAGGRPRRPSTGGGSMRARQPDRAGLVDVDGVRIRFEVYGDSGSAMVFTPTDTIVDSRMWKAQVPWLARRHRVVVIDPRGNGGSDR